jgi:hypothetical protein
MKENQAKKCIESMVMFDAVNMLFQGLISKESVVCAHKKCKVPFLSGEGKK